MVKTIILVLIICGTLLFVFSFLFMTLSFNKTGSGKYNFLSYFPYELNQFKRYSKKSWFYLTLMILSSLLIAFALVFYIYLFQNHSIVYLLSILMIISLIVFNLLFFIKLSNFKLHLIFAIVYYLLNILVFCIELFIFTNSYTAGIVVSNTTIVWIFALIGLIFLIIIGANPSYKSWAKMVKVDAQTYNRPPRNYLAILEWGSFIASLLTYIPLIASMY